jgi:hypothetical protein
VRENGPSLPMMTKPLHQLTVSDIHALVGNVRKTIE